jgi:hypothetical protein
MLRGDKIWWVSPRRGVSSIVETTIKSVGTKYITTERDSRVKFDVNTLREIDATGYGSFLVMDIDRYKEKQFYLELRRKLSKFDWGIISNETVMEVSKILGLINESGVEVE